MLTHSWGGSAKLKPWLYITIRFWFRASFCVETKLSWMPKRPVLTEHVCLGSLIDVDCLAGVSGNMVSFMRLSTRVFDITLTVIFIKLSYF